MRLDYSTFAAIVAIAANTSAHAQPCHIIDFDNLAVGTVITAQYEGVTFDGRNPDGTASFDAVIYNPNGPTSSEPQCLSAQGSGGFSQEFIRATFDRDQTEVTFTLGVRFTGGGCSATDTVIVRYYTYDSQTGAYSLAGAFTPPVNGTLPTDRVYVFVRVVRPGNAAFRRIEIEGDLAHGCGARFELIDDLSFDIDNTPPVAEITTPAVYACQCNSTPVIGSAYDPDGGIQSWRLERKAPDAAAWTLIAQNAAEIVNNQLAIWTTTAATGWYVLRLTVTNECGLIAEDSQLVWLDKSFDNVSLRSPIAGAIFGGNVCADGTVSDHCGGSFLVTHRRAPAAPIGFSNIPASWVTTDPLGNWNTRDGATPDGPYDVLVTALDECNNVGSVGPISIIVDNTPPTAIITSPLSCVALNGVVPVNGIVSDAHIAGWTLLYTGGDTHDWIPIGQGAGNVNGVLANWDTSGLRPCCYTLRLVASDSASVDCGSRNNQREYTVSVEVGGAECAGDLDGDGSVGLTDLGLFLARFGSICP